MKDSPWPTCARAVTAFAVIFALFLLAGCQTTEPHIIPKIVERQIEVPKSLLTCLPEPVAREAWETQRDVALFLIKVAEAGQDCRIKLDQVRKLLASQ